MVMVIVSVSHPVVTPSEFVAGIVAVIVVVIIPVLVEIGVEVRVVRDGVYETQSQLEDRG